MREAGHPVALPCPRASSRNSAYSWFVRWLQKQFQVLCFAVRVLLSECSTQTVAPADTPSTGQPCSGTMIPPGRSARPDASLTLLRRWQQAVVRLCGQPNQRLSHHHLPFQCFYPRTLKF